MSLAGNLCNGFFELKKSSSDSFIFPKKTRNLHRRRIIYILLYNNTIMTKSALQIARAAYQPKLPKALKGAVKVQEGEPTQSVADQEAIKALFPNTYGMPLIKFVEGEATEHAPMNVGVILSGGQAPGGHNVISGLFDGIKKLNPANKLYGFILGPGGLVDHKYIELTSDIIDEYRNTGGFDIIGSGRTKLEKE